ncbi:hypothetical protein ACERII_05695 [Evansella sp. AB-rgal1]|uniref:hypothetical protein n=1 Tax=Evansella sp. AB-rgal1 TaxID=3242696 RepID=UPI00359E2FA8
MYNIIFYEKNDHVLSQTRESVPEEGDGIKLKGRKGNVVSVETGEDNIVYILVDLAKKIKE